MTNTIPTVEHLTLQAQFIQLQLAHLKQQRELNQMQDAAARTELARVMGQIRELQAAAAEQPEPTSTPSRRAKKTTEVQA